MNETLDVVEKWHANPLVQGILRAWGKVEVFKADARQFYYAVLLSAYSCPICGGRLRMTGPSECRCECEARFDPTVEFQRSSCCGAPLSRRALHYACSACKRIVPSRFLFDERVFDAAYFCEKMQESRERKRNKSEEIRALLAGARSGDLCITDLPNLGSIPGLEMALNNFIGLGDTGLLADFRDREEFRMNLYREAILGALPTGCSIHFSGISPLCENPRMDRARRFVTLIFMEQAGEVELIQHENDILVERHETHGER